MGLLDSQQHDNDCLILSSGDSNNNLKISNMESSSRKRVRRQLYDDVASKKPFSSDLKKDFCDLDETSKKSDDDIYVVDQTVKSSFNLSANVTNSPSNFSLCRSGVNAVSNVPKEEEQDVEVISVSSDESSKSDEVPTTSSQPEDSIYEVEAILDFIHEDKIDFYLVKWKGWSDADNTWEPAANLEGCNSLIKKFHRLNPYLKCSSRSRQYINEYGILENGPQTAKERKMDVFLQKHARIISTLLNEFANDEQQKNGRKYKSSVLISKFLTTIEDDEEETRYTVLMPEGLKSVTMSGVKFKRFVELKKKTLQKLKDWQDEINKVSMDPAPIVVINEVDLEIAPESFTYINDYEAGNGITIPADPLVGCDCSSCLKNKNSCCGHQSGTTFAYNRFKRLIIPPGSPIYECNKRCACGPDCVNRVVQHGRKMKLAIFRTSNHCGWGVKTLEPIPKGTFVMEYVGEVITEQEAESRGHKYDAEGRTYLFDLDYDAGDCTFTVDAAYLGNVSHFMNHSCEPNLAVYGVWINNLDPRLPRLAFFSTRDIKRGEELNFDYMMSAGVNTSSGKSPKSTPTPKLSTNTSETLKRIHCKCGSKNCRKYLF